MTARARRSQPVEATFSDQEVVDEGAERYIWVFPEEDRIVLAIPGLRGLKFSTDEARAVGEMLIQTADEIADHQKNLVEGGGSCGSSEEHPVER